MYSLDKRYSYSAKDSPSYKIKLNYDLESKKCETPTKYIQDDTEKQVGEEQKQSDDAHV